MTIRLLVTTARAQGERKSDFHWATEGELIRLPAICDSDRGRPDSRCGCARSFVGLDSRRTTTTTQVAEVDITVDEYAQRLFDNQNIFNRDECLADAQDMIRAVADMPVGMVIERRGLRLQERPVVSGRFKVVLDVACEVDTATNAKAAEKIARDQLFAQGGWGSPQAATGVYEVPGAVGPARRFIVVIAVVREFVADGARHALELAHTKLTSQAWTLVPAARGDLSGVTATTLGA